MIKNYFKIVWRNIARHKFYTIINVLGLSLGICGSLVIYLIISFELSYDNFHPDKELIYRIVASQQSSDGKKEDIGGTINPLPAAIRRELTGFESVTVFHNYSAKVIVPDGNLVAKRFEAAKRGEEVSPVIIADPRYFDLFKYQWLAGNPVTALKEPFSVVLSEKEAYKYFGRLDLTKVIGRDLYYKDVYFNDSLHLSVTGIVKDWEKNTDFGFSDFISYATVEHSFLRNEISLDNWGNWNPDAQGFVKLTKGVSVAHVEKQFPGFLNAHVPPYPGFKTTMSLQPLSTIHFNSQYRDAYSRKAHLPTLYGLIGIAAFILIIAAINFINLSTAQSLYRVKEIGVRKVLGSSKTSLIFQFLIETFIITFISLLTSIAISFPVINSFGPLIPAGVTVNVFNPGNILFLLLVTVVTSLLAGFYPAKVLSSCLTVLSLKGTGSQKISRKSYFRQGLIVFQFTVSLAFIISTIIIGNQIMFIRNKDLGFTKDAIITFRTGWNNPENQAGLFAEKLRHLPAVRFVSTHMETPAAKGHSRTYIMDTGKPETKLDASYELGDENYVPLFGLKLIAGRNILPSDTVKEFLVNETCAKGLGFRTPGDAIGKLAQTGMNEGRGFIVGVINDFHSKSLHEPVSPFFISSDKNHERAVSVKLATIGMQSPDLKGTAIKMEKIWKEFYPDEKFVYSFFDETIARLYENEHKTALLMNTATVITIFISCMGLFGLATFTARQRLKEIGIRKVLGATVTGLVAMLSLDFLKLVGLALVFASPVAYYCMHLWLQDYAYRIAISWWVFACSGLLAVGIALLTISFQSIKAAITNPVKNLREE